MPVAYWEFFWLKFFSTIFLYGILLVLSRWCFHHLVENSILYKKDIQPIGPILFSENNIILSVVGGKVDGQILFGARSEKPKKKCGARGEEPKILFGPKWQLWKILFGSQRVKVRLFPYNYIASHSLLDTPTILSSKVI